MSECFEFRNYSELHDIYSRVFDNQWKLYDEIVDNVFKSEIFKRLVKFADEGIAVDRRTIKFDLDKFSKKFQELQEASDVVDSDWSRLDKKLESVDGELSRARKYLDDIDKYLKLKFSSDDLVYKSIEEIMYSVPRDVDPDKLLSDADVKKYKRLFERYDRLLKKAKSKPLHLNDKRKINECSKMFEELLKKIQDWLKKQYPGFKTEISCNSNQVSKIRRQKQFFNEKGSPYRIVHKALNIFQNTIESVSMRLVDTSKYLDWKKELDTEEKFKANISKYLYREKYGKPSPADVRQAGIGSCGILSALIGIAKTNPGFIEHTLIDENKGKVIVRFHTNLKNPIAVNTKPLDYSIFKKHLANCKHKAAWPLIVECAYIQTINPNLHSVFNEAGVGTDASENLFYLTGKIGETKDEGALGEGSTLYELVREKGSSHVYYKKIEKILKEHKFALVSFRKEIEKDEGMGIYNEHSYCLLGVTEKEGEAYVILQNPHGEIQMPKRLTSYEIGSMGKLPDFKNLSDIETKGKITRQFTMRLEKFFDLHPKITYFSSKQSAKKALEKGEESK